MFRSLKEDITESQTDIRIQKSDLFEIPLSLNCLLYTSPLYKLSDHVYKVFFRDLALQDTLADRIADLMNRIGLSQISFDRLEGCSYTGHDEYAISRFAPRCYTQFNYN